MGPQTTLKATVGCRCKLLFLRHGKNSILTTKITKDTRVRAVKISTFVRFVSFVVKA